MVILEIDPPYIVTLLRQLQVSESVDNSTCGGSAKAKPTAAAVVPRLKAE